MKKVLCSVIVASFLILTFGQAYANGRGYFPLSDQRQYHNRNHHPPRHHAPRHHYNPPRHTVHHHKHHSNAGNVALGVLGGIVALATLGAITAPTRQPASPAYYQSQGEYNREMQLRSAYARYNDCLAQRDADLRYGIPPHRAKDCRGLDPQNMDWSYR